MLILYSTNTFLAFTISEKYFKGRHYFWCAPCFDPRTESSLNASLPPTASPAEIYEAIWSDVTRGDLHSPRIAQNRLGIIAGATQHKHKGTISLDSYSEIVEIVHAAAIPDFRPLLFLAPRTQLKRFIKAAPIAARAHPLSSEYIAEGVPRDHFDVIELIGRR